MIQMFNIHLKNNVDIYLIITFCTSKTTGSVLSFQVIKKKKKKKKIKQYYVFHQIHYWSVLNSGSRRKCPCNQWIHVINFLLTKLLSRYDARKVAFIKCCPYILHLEHRDRTKWRYGYIFPSKSFKTIGGTIIKFLWVEGTNMY